MNNNLLTAQLIYEYELSVECITYGKARGFYEINGFAHNYDECTCEIMQKQLVDARYILELINNTKL